jgi:UDP-N-acetylglucosamine transferase subunit ALG13
MILVTVGTHGQFDRLIKKVDDLVKEGKITNVVAQIGYSTYIPKYIENYFTFTELERMEKLIKRADIIITHAGIASLLLSMRLGKRTIVVPRLKKFKEHITDHQVQIVHQLEREKRVLPVYNIDDLEKALVRIKKIKIKPVISREKKIFKIISSYLNRLDTKDRWKK